MRLIIFIVAFIFSCGVQQVAAQVNFSSRPSSLQLYPRDLNDSAIVTISGDITITGITQAIFTMHKNGALSDSSIVPVNYNGSSASFAKNYSIPAEKSHYRFKMYLYDGAIVTQTLRSDSVCSGDVYLINGQSNGQASANGLGVDAQNIWVRSFGSQNNVEATCQADTVWGMGSGSSGNNHLSIGVWAIRLGKMLADSSGIPVCFINGCRSGVRIIEHLPSPIRTDLNSYYGRLLYRAQKAGVTNKIKAFFWYQGESDTDTAYLQYANRFAQLYSAWKTDYPTLQKIVVIQTRPGCIISSTALYHQHLREILRTLPNVYLDVTLSTSVGVPEYDGCHFTTQGYQMLAAQLYGQYCDDFIGKPQIPESDPPRLLSAAYTNNSNTEISLIFDQQLQWPNPYNGYNMKDYLYLNGSVSILNGSCINDTLKLQLSISSNADKISYLPGIYYAGTTNEYQGPWLLNNRNVGTPSFYQFGISNNLTITSDHSPSICLSDSVTLSTTRTGQNYQWYRDGVLIAGATQQQYVAKLDGSYTLVMTDVDNISLTSNVIVVSYSSAITPVISTSNSRSVFCPGNSLTLVCNQGTSWLWNTGDTTSSIITTGPGDFTVRITTPNGCTGVSDTFRVALDIPNTPVITSDKPGLCIGDSAMLSIDNYPSILWSNGSTQTFIYVSDTSTYSVTINDSIGCSAVSNPVSLPVLTAPAATITPSSLFACPGQSISLISANTASNYLWSTGQTTLGISVTSSGNYTLTITDQYGCKGISPAVELTIASPTISVTPSGSKAICTGGSQLLTANNNSLPGTFQWYKNAGAIANANGSTYMTTTAGSYNVKFTDTYGCSATSAATVISVSSFPAATFTITNQNDFCVDSNVTLTANTAAGLSYQWQRNLVDIPSANSQVYVTPSSGSYRVITSNVAGCTKSATAKSIPIVNPAPVATFTLSDQFDFCNDTIVTLSANTAAGLTYQWQKNLIDIPGATSQVYVTPSKGSYRVITSSAAGCTKAATAKAIPIVSPAPVATFTISDQFDVCQDSIVTLTANAATGLTYQWQKSSVNIPGANSQVYVTQAKGSYRVITSNTSGCTKAATAKTLPIVDPTATTTASGPLAICNGDSVVLTANSGTNYTYQWLRVSTVLAGAVQQSYAAKTAGNYRVRVTNAIGCSAMSTYKIVTVSNCGTRMNSANSNDVNDELSVYPQPFKNEFILELIDGVTDDTDYYFEMRSAAGQQVIQLNHLLFNNDHAVINAEFLTPGLYFYRLVNNKNIYHGRLIKE